jgi:hypothetical protein
MSTWRNVTSRPFEAAIFYRDLSRNGTNVKSRVSLASAVSFRDQRREPSIESHPWLELQGKAIEPVKGVTEVKISLYPKDELQVGTARPASCGAIIGAKPELHAIITWSQMEFDRVWTLAMSGHLKWAYLYFTKPHYGGGLVVSASFGNEFERVDFRRRAFSRSLLPFCRKIE